MRIKRLLSATFLAACMTPVVQAGVIVSNPVLAGVSVSTMAVTWASTNTATAFKVDASTDPAFGGVLISSITPDPTATGATVGLLSPFTPNTTYYVRIGGVSGGTTSYINTVPAGLSTLASVPPIPAISNVGSSSFTVTWGTAGNPSYTLYQVEMAQTSNFSGMVTVPIPFSANLTANTTNVIGLAPNTAYWVRIRAQNSNGVQTLPGQPIGATTQQNGIGTGAGSGLGKATVLPSAVPEGAVVTSTISFKVPTGGMNAGGRLEVDLPIGWWPFPLQNTSPTQDGYVSATSTAAVAFNLLFGTSTPNVTLSFGAGSIPAATVIQLTFNNIHPNCPAPGQTQAAWEVKSAMSPSDPLGDIATQPLQTFTTGQAQWIGYNPWSILTVVTGQPSQAITIQSNDNCGQPAPLAAPLTISLHALLPDNITADTNASFSNVANFSPTTTTVTIPSGSSSAVYYYQTTSSGTNLQIRGDYVSPVGGANQQVWRPVNVLAGPYTFSNVAVDTGLLAAGQKSVTISPDGSGVNNFGYVRFTPSDNTTQWHVAISSNGFQTNVFERWGTGDPQGTVSWDGRNYNASVPPAGTAAVNVAPQVVANGTYNVKVEVVGLVTDTSSSITINTAQITGNVKLSGVPVSGAQINAQGSNTPGFSFTTTDTNGNYVLNGLRSGYQYNLYATYISSTNQAVVTGQANNVSAGGTANFTLATPALLRVSAVLSSSAPYTVFGSLNVHSSDYSQNFFGNLRILAGATTSDNGDPFNPSSWTVLYVQPSQTYTLQPFVPGFGATNVTVTGSSDVVISLLAKANVYGMINLPSAVTNPTWISVEGVLQGNSFPTAWGGAFFNVGQSSGVFSIYSVNPGVYTFRARPPGYVPAAVANITVASTDLGNSTSGGGVDFSSSAFSTGGQISGLLTVSGDTSGQSNPFPLWISAYSPSLGLNVFTQVSLSTSSTSTSTSYQLTGVADGTYQVFPPWLQGFELSTPGPQSVTVTGGTGSLNLTLNQVNGKIVGAVNLGGATDYNNVHLSIQGPYPAEIDLLSSSSTYAVKHLGTGNYTLIATYRTTGAQIQKQFLLSNGQTLTLDLNLNIPTFSVSGIVSVQSAFQMRNSSNTLVTINTLSDLLATASTQTLTLNATGQMNVAGSGTAVAAAGGACTGGTSFSTTTVRVEAFPKNFFSFGNANRSNFNNCYGVGDYKYGIVDSSGNYVIPGLTPGIWEVDVYPYFDGGQLPNAAVASQIVSVVSSNVSKVNFALSNGNSISGQLSLPAGVTDTRSFNAQIVSPRGDLVQSAPIMITAANSATYQFTGLPSGSYALLIQDPGSWDMVLQQNVIKYVAKPLQFTIAGADLAGENITMSRASSIVGKLLLKGSNPDGTPALTLITPNNENLLPNNFFINANADPWVPGGSAGAQWGPTGLSLDNNNQFHINGLVAGTYDVNFQQNSYGLSVQGAGSLNLASLTKASIVVAEAQTVDLGTITLVPGISLSGTVTDTSGNPLANIPVEADPSNNSKNGNGQIRVFTDSHGNFTLAGLDPGIKIYNIIVARRPSPGDSSSQPVPYGSATKLAVDVTQVPPPTLSFSLPPANAQLSGTIVTADGGPLSYPESDQAGFPEAAIYVRLSNTVNEDNPLGDSNASNLDGSFTIPYLPAGTYDITVESLGYRPYRSTGVVVTNGNVNLGTITLQNGPSLDATLAMPDGTSVNTSNVDFAVAATSDLGSIIFGRIASDSNTGNITGIHFSGFELSPKTYSVLLFDKQNNIFIPPEGKNLVFTANTDAVTKALTYQPSSPFAIAHVRKSGSSILLTYFLSRPLRNRGDDQDPTQWVTVTKGNGSLSGYTVSADRREFDVTYTPALGEQNATIAFSAHTVDVDPTTGVEFVLSKVVTLLLGQKATAENNISPIFGGSVSLSDNSDPSNVSIPSNALLLSTGSLASGSTSYAVTFTATDDTASVTGAVISGVGARAVHLPAMVNWGPGAYVPEAYHAMQAAIQPHAATINPLSSFYSILLPAGISHQLNANATITLNYDTSADPSQINVYYFNGVDYLLENTNRIVDTVNHTISVSVSHFSTFVVLQNSAQVILVSGDTSADSDVEVMNFPNPFNLQTKTETLIHGGTTGSLPTDGTIIRYVIPASMVGAATIDIYDIVGEKIRSIDLGVPTTGAYQYVTWDGRNDSGNKVASGVYIGVFKVGGTKKFWKMAVIK